MKRQLHSAYDHMIMPDSCTRRIEQRLTQQLQAKKEGRYLKSVSPAQARRNGWKAAVTAVCLVLILSAGGSLLLLKMPDRILTVAKETLVSAASEEITPTVTPANHYAIATTFSVEKIENFAKSIQDHVLNKNWDALSNKISYSITIQNQEIRERKKFIEWMEIFALNPSFTEAIRNESCTAMFCNWQGICMGDGQIWFNEVDGELKITALNVEPREEILQKDQKKHAPMEFAAVLSGEAVKFIGSREETSLDQYCGALWGEVTVKGFTVVDVDDDTVCEIVVSAQMPDKTVTNHLVLRLEGEEICAYPFRNSDLYDLKKDGSFSRSSYGPSQGAFWLTFEGKGSCSITRDHVESDTPLADWHAYPCVRPELVLASYEYAGTGQSRFPGNPYYTFEMLIRGEAGNNWESHKEQMTRWGMICLEEEGTVTVFDPDAPGCCLFGTLTNENGFLQFADIGYYISNEYGEREVKVLDLLSEKPQYIAGSHLEDLDAHGGEMDRLEALLEYLS